MTGRIALNCLLMTAMGGALIASAPAQAPDRVPLKPEVESFIERMRAEHGFDAGELRATFAQIKPSEGVIKAFSAPATARPWHEFRALFLTPLRIEGGVAFWRENAELLASAKAVYGVPEEVIVAIIGVETIYGRRTGSFRVVDTLYTLGFEGPRRNEFFRSELEQFLLLTRENGLDLLETRGSFAGAMGMPQFIASSYRKYAVDFSGDGKIDLWNDTADVVGSVANYLRRFGWEPEQRVTVPVRLTVNDVQHLVDLGVRPHLTVSELKMRGVEVLEDLPPDQLAGVFTLEMEQGVEHWLSLNNFYVITRYNNSRKYAMAVHQLAATLAQARRQAGEPAQTVSTAR
jgi:membrane-bound lytic murein transglycosylase B